MEGGDKKDPRKGFISYPARLDRLWVLGVKQPERDGNYLHAVPRLRSRGEFNFRFLFPESSIPVLGSTQAPIQRVPRFFPRGTKRPGLDAEHSAPSAPLYAC